MIQLKEINPRLYMKGTKAAKFQGYLWLGLLGYTTAVVLPILYFSYDKIRLAREENLRQREEAERLQFENITQMYGALQQERLNPTDSADR